MVWNPFHGAFRPLAVVALTVALSAPPASAGGEEFRVRCAILLKRLVAQVHDPWKSAALRSRARKFRQPVINHENIVVAPLWKMIPDGPPIERLRKAIPQLVEAGVTNVYMPPTYEQMLYHFFGAENIHGYWPKSFDLTRVDPRLGTNGEYLRLLEDMREAGLRLTLDIDARHIGYPPADGKVTLWGREMSVTDPDYFVQAKEPSAKDFARAELRGHRAMHVYTEMKMWGLPMLNVKNPWVRENLIADHVRAVDLGYTSFRIDSAKHMQSDFIRDLVVAMSRRAESRGEKLKFILEYFSGNYSELALKLSEIGNLPGLQFIDFRAAGVVREAIVDGRSFRKIQRAAEELEELGVDRGFFIQAITDQDGFYPPIYHGTVETQDQTHAAMALSTMTGTNRPYYVAGLEQAEAPGTLRNMPKKFFDHSSPAAEGIVKMNRYFNENFSRLKPFASSDILAADGDGIMIRRTFIDGKKKLILVIDRSEEGVHLAAARLRYAGGRMVFSSSDDRSRLRTYLLEVTD